MKHKNKNCSCFGCNFSGTEKEVEDHRCPSSDGRTDIPMKISTNVYYMVKKGKIMFDIESMEEDFDKQVNELVNKFNK